jgi:hypothetical protein
MLWYGETFPSARYHKRVVVSKWPSDCSAKKMALQHGAITTDAGVVHGSQSSAPGEDDERQRDAEDEDSEARRRAR